MAKLDHWKIYRALGYEMQFQTEHYGRRSYPVAEVRAFHDSDARVKICTAPARSGKSYSAAHDIIPDIIAPMLMDEVPHERRHLIVGPEYEHASKEFGYIADALVHNRHKLGLPPPTRFHNQPKTGRLEIRWDEWKTVVIGKSTKQIASLLGDQYKTAILSETAQLSERVWLQGLSTRVERAIWPTTPSVYGRWIKDFYETALSQGDSRVAHFQFPPWANPFYDKVRFDEELARRGPRDPFFREQFLGDWDVFYGGRVFPSFQAEEVEDVSMRLNSRGISGGEGHHCIEPLNIPNNWKRVGGMDFGWKDPTVFLFGAVSPKGELIIYDEYYQPQRSLREHVEAIREMARVNGTPWPPREVYRERKGQALQLSEDLSMDHGLHTIDANPDRMAGRLLLQQYLDKGKDGLPMLRVVRDRCPHLVKQLLELHYPMEETHRENSMEKWLGDDHAVDALRYLVMGRPAPMRMVQNEAYGRPRTLDEIKREYKRQIRRGALIGHNRDARGNLTHAQ